MMFFCRKIEKNDIMYKAVKYENRNEALAAFRKMVERKKEWIKKTEQEFYMLRHLAEI